MPMPTLAQFAAFTIASIVLIEIPGPSLLFALGRALTVGRRDAILSVIGNASGVLVQGVAAAVGLGALVATSTTAFTVLKLVGAAYVVYLGVQAIRRRGEARAALEQGDGARRTSGFDAARAGFVVGVTNPKTIVFLMAFLPQFIAADAPAVPQLLLLGALFAVLSCVSDAIWVLAASQAKTWFARRPERLDGLGLTGGVMMIGVGGFLATSHNA